MTESASPDLFCIIPTSGTPTKSHSRRSELGQYLTSNDISTFMAALFPALPASITLLDAGAGAGALTIAFVARWQRDIGDGGKITSHAYELDAAMLNALHETANELRKKKGVTIEVTPGDFIEKAATMLRLERGPRFTHAILNPPYKKINTGSDHRAFLRAAAIETVNLYSGFVALAIALMERGGEVVAIIPRSFCNGPYYQPFRQFICTRAAIQHIHLFERRNKAFQDDGVLQENIIIRLTCGLQQGEVTISTSTDNTFKDYSETSHPFHSIMKPGDAGQFIHIPTGASADLLDAPAFGFGLHELGLSVSTGPVVDFRMRNDLRAVPDTGTVPLLYPGHFSHGRMTWPKPGFKKANAILHTPDTEKWLFPSGFYAVVRRFSSKEERRRIVANVVEPAAQKSHMIGFENHLNVIHQGKKPLDEDTARGITVYLNCTAVDNYFRKFNGHTQVNATDLRTMRYPARRALAALAEYARGNPQPSQEEIDAWVTKLV